MMRILFLIAIGLSVLACSDEPKVSGTATDTENTIAGVVLDAKGKPVSQVEVRLVTDSIAQSITSLGLAKIATSTLITQTDEQGRYIFTDIDSQQIFSLAFISPQSETARSGALLRNLQLSQNASRQYKEVRLVPSIQVSGKLTVVDAGSALVKLKDSFRVAVAGFGESVEIKANESFSFDAIPVGTITFVVYPSDEATIAALVNKGVPKDSLYTRYTYEINEAKPLTMNLAWRFPLTYRCISLVGDAKCMSGVVVNHLDDPVEGVEVRVILDSLGFSYVKGYVATDTTVAYTAADGSWILPVPAVSRFHLEYLKSNKSQVLVGVASHPVSERKWVTGINKLDSVVIVAPAIIKGKLLYTEEQDAWIAVGSHFRVGIKGTSRYKDVLIGQAFELTGLPNGSQTLVEYPGDEYLWPTFQTKLGSLVAMINTTQFVVLTPGIVLEEQVDTYTLPVLD